MCVMVEEMNDHGLGGMRRGLIYRVRRCYAGERAGAAIAKTIKFYYRLVNSKNNSNLT